MGADSKIQWTDHTFNPWVGCQRVSPGCEHCYAEAYDKRVGGGIDPSDGVKKLRWGPTAPRVRTSPANWKEPLKWNRKATAAGVRERVFCSSLADVFEDREELVPWRYDLFGMIEQTPSLDWLLLTKRPENIARLWPGLYLPNSLLVDCPPPGPRWRNVWLGTTVEDQRRADERIPELLKVPAAVHFLSCEPLLEAIDIFTPALKSAEMWALEPNMHHHSIGWVIVGGESGGKARPFDVAWARSLRDQVHRHLKAAHFFVKQLGAAPFDSDRLIGTFAPYDRRTPKKPDGAGGEMDRGNLVLLKDRHGGDPSEWPEDLRVREFPVSAL